MKQLKLASLLVVGAVATTACVDDAPTVPAVGAPTLEASFSQTAETTGNHLVVFEKEQIAAGFAETVAALGGTIEAEFGSVGAATVSGLDAAGVAALETDGAVSIVEPEIVLELPEPPLEPEAVAAELGLASPGDPSDAARYARQWHLRAIGADQAWAAGVLGSANVTVAILDTGIGYTHPDLQGLVDLGRSASFLPDEDAAVQYFFPGAHPVADLHYHGTHVAATVASNAVAAAGVTSRTTLMGVKVCRSGVTGRGGCPGGAIFAGVRHAVENGADVINMSLGGAFLKSGSKGHVAVINRLFSYAHRNHVTVVVAAGNAAADLDRNYYPNREGEQTHFPSLYAAYCDTPNNICVSATGPTASAGVDGPWTDVDAPATYTNFGRSAINVAAPGGNTGGSVWAACSTFSVRIPICQTDTFILGVRGTSMAAPHVSGLAALMVARHGKSPSKVRAAIQQSADDLGESGTDAFYGKGRINVATAVGL